MTKTPPAFKAYISGAFECRLCGRMIRMIRTEKDRSMPVDAEPTRVTKSMTDEGLPIRLIDRMGRNRIHLEGSTGFETHFATCPEYDGAPPEERSRIRAPNPTRRSISHMLDRMNYLQEGLNRVAKMHKKKYESSVFLAELGHLATYAKHTNEIISQE